MYHLWVLLTRGWPNVENVFTKESPIKNYNKFEEVYLNPHDLKSSIEVLEKIKSLFDEKKKLECYLLVDIL